MNLNRVRINSEVVEYRGKEGNLVGRIKELDTHYKVYVAGYGELMLGYMFMYEAEEDMIKKYKEINL